MTKILRGPQKLFDVLKKEAKQKGISVNALILSIIWDWIENQNIK